MRQLTNLQPERVTQAIHERRLMNYDDAVAQRNRDNYKRWASKWKKTIPGRWVKWEENLIYNVPSYLRRIGAL